MSAPNLTVWFLVIEYLRFALKDKQKKTSDAHKDPYALLHNINQPFVGEPNWVIEQKVNHSQNRIFQHV